VAHFRREYRVVYCPRKEDVESISNYLQSFFVDTLTIYGGVPSVEKVNIMKQWYKN
jgi:superfamily II DNA helicase RecQ